MAALVFCAEAVAAEIVGMTGSEREVEALVQEVGWVVARI